MRRPTDHVIDALAILAIGVGCLPLLALLVPNFERSRTEARITMAYSDVRHLRESVSLELAAKAAVLPDRDPWDQPYRIVPLGDDDSRVVSSGPNRVSPPSGLDGDDIYSDMSTSPMKAIIARKQRQSLVALSTTGVAWFLLAAYYLRSRRRSSAARRRSSSGPEPTFENVQ